MENKKELKLEIEFCNKTVDFTKFVQEVLDFEEGKNKKELKK